MSIPERTIDHLTNWIVCSTKSDEKANSYKHHCENLIKQSTLTWLPIPCPHCFINSNLNTSLKQIGDVLGIGVSSLKCVVCGMKFPELIAIDFEMLELFIKKNLVSELFSQLEYDDVWFVEGGDYKFKLNTKLLKRYLTEGNFDFN